MKLAILTSTATRHRYFARRLASWFDVVAVGYENVEYSHERVEMPDETTTAECEIVARHFTGREAAELTAFGMSPYLYDNVCMLEPGWLNRPSMPHALKLAGADTVAVFGTSLIKPPLLTLCPGRMINMHLGLSPYYRGTATNFYPLLNGEPEYVGATIHLLDEGIDSGPIFRHARPTIVAGDTPHTIGCKAIEAGTDAMIEVLQNLDHLTPIPQRDVALLKPPYLRKDYHPREVVELHETFDGTMERYLKEDREAPSLVRCNDDET